MLNAVLCVVIFCMVWIDFLMFETLSLVYRLNEYGYWRFLGVMYVFSITSPTGERYWKLWLPPLREIINSFPVLRRELG
jgi:hypothetical protein